MIANRPSIEPDLPALLEWYRAAGVDIAVGEQPVDRFKASALRTAADNRTQSTPVPSAPSPAAMPPAGAGTAPGSTAEAAEALAADATTLEQLRALLDAFDGCPLKLRATQLVFADGNPEADIMFIGEAPGREEDLQGKPFVGRSGQLLDRIMAAIGLDRTKVYIANTVPWRPPGNRTPTPAEIAVCLPFLYRQIALVDPKIIVTLGAPAAHTMFATKTPISRMRGQWRDLTLGDRTIRAMPTMHPAFLLRQPAQKALVWRDMLSLRQAMDALAT